MKYLLLFSAFCWSALLHAQTEGLRIEPLDGPTPWTSLEIEAPEDQFQFAIVTDRTGGARPGVFSEAVDKLNLLRPPFVMSVGDLINGYTRYLPELNRQWDQFDGMVDRLEMPFFYLPGNHDITNDVMDGLWRERYGPSYYHFVYKDVLFLCMNSEDGAPGAGKGRILDEQFEYFERVLNENAEARWTLVFIHQPLWDQEAPTGRWAEIETLLQEREHTVYAGHVHRYQKFQRNNGRYFTLATTGGGSRLRGPQLGEFDHVSWVTMTDDGPIMANIALDGIHDDSLRTTEDAAFVSDLIASQPVQFGIPEATADGTGYTVPMQLHNPTDLLLHVEVDPAFSWGYSVVQPIDTVTVHPNTVEDYTLRLLPKGDVTAGATQRLDVDLRFQYVGRDVSIPFTYLLNPAEGTRRIGKDVGRTSVDGDLGDWEALDQTIRSQDAGDLSIRWGIVADDEFVYFGAEVTDDHVSVEAGRAPGKQDFVGLVVNADPLAGSLLDGGEARYERSFYLLVSPPASPGGEPVVKINSERYPFDVPLASKITAEGYTIELALPLEYVRDRQGTDWGHLRVNVIAQDDDPEDAERYKAFWRPEWRGPGNVVGSGLFLR